MPNRIIPYLLLCCSVFNVHAALPTKVDGQPLPSLAPMLERATPAVVNISTRTFIRYQEHPLMRDPFFRWFFDMPEQPRRRENHSLGSGVVIDAKKGHVITNHHVIDKADEITVTLRDGRQFNAKVIGFDSETDVALLKIPPEKLTALPLANSDKLRVGDFVVAVGNPFGLGQTVTSGIISALGRTGLGIEGYEDFIQTDASINPGNSGGALVNLRGELVGINTAIIAPAGGNVGIGFAIPINMAVRIVEHLEDYGEVRRGALGLQAQTLTPELARAFDYEGKGALVTEVIPDSPADRAGLKSGDIIVEINDRRIESESGVHNSLGLLRIGDKVWMTVVRDKKKLRLKTKIEQQEYILGEQISPYLSGASLREIKLTSRRGEQNRVEIQSVSQNSVAWYQGLRKGDVILSLNRTSVSNLNELAQLLQYRRRQLIISVLRQERVLNLILR
ncbi:MAG: DegQ family serine endoprotease [Pseudomonadota bacterium]